MKLQYLKDTELEISLQNAVRTERKIIHIVILHIQEISRRKIFLARGYSSLFEYLVKEAKYSSSAAQRRIEAARLVTAVPSVAESLQSGDLNLSQIGEVQRAVKEAQKIHQTEITNEVKTQLVKAVLNQNQSNTQQICAEALNIPVIQAEAMKTQKDKSKRVEITFTAEQFAKYEQVRDQLAHKNFQKKRSQSMADVLETMFEELLKSGENKATFKRRASIPTESTAASVHAAPAPETKENAVTAMELDDSNTWKSLTPKRKRIVLNADSGYQYKDQKSGRVCGSRFNLEVDHLHPKWDQGSNERWNLRPLCRSHNQFRFRK
jgi:hypothetical protein